MENLQKTIDRVEKMEQLLDEIQLIYKTNPKRIVTDIAVQEKIQMLEAYLDSGQWLCDYECDERGELPAALKRGVLSQDALYDLLTEIKWSYEKREEGSETTEVKLGVQ